LTIDRQRIENELIRSRLIQKFQMIIEDQNGYENILSGNYRSEYKADCIYWHASIIRQPL
jgi:hypothetical protein